MIVTLIGHTVLNWDNLKRTAIPNDARDDQLKGTDAEQLTEIAGRICYDSFGVGRPSSDYHKHIRMVGHGSVLEHATINLLIQNVSRGFTHELIRHRVGTAVSQRSTRFVDESGSVVHAHPILKDVMNDISPFEFSEIMQHVAVVKSSNRHLYSKLVALIESHLVDKGLERSYARKQARGAARGYLENGMDTELVFSMNLRAALNIIDQRARKTADAEIREFAIHLLKICKKVAPAYFKHIRISRAPLVGEHVVKPARIRI